MVGFLDMASNITAGIRETTTVFEGGDINRERLPRYTGKDGIVTVSEYSTMERGGFFLNIYPHFLVLFSKRSIGSNVVERNGERQILQRSLHCS